MILTRCRFPLALLLCVFLQNTSDRFAPGQSNQTQLPSESSLPPPSVDDSKSTPSENELPKQSGQAKPASDRNQLPAENVFPGQRAPANNNPLAGRSRPILRLDYEGHTSRIRTLSQTDDGKFFVSGGDDKDIHVWRRDPRDVSRWFHHRTIRWQVARGPRGRIFSLACKGNIVAVGGAGAMGINGELYLFDVVTGKLISTLIDAGKGHRQVIKSLAWSPGKTRMLASHDLDGQIMVWRQNAQSGLWSGQTIVEPDLQNLDADTANKLAEFRGFAALTFRTESELVIPAFVRFDEQAGNRRAIWKLSRVDVVSGKTQSIENPELAGDIRFLTASPDGKFVVCGVGDQTVRIWKFDAQGSVVRRETLRVGATPSSGRFSAAGNRLFVSTEIVNDHKVARIQSWNLSGERPAFIGEILPDFHVADVQFTENPKQIIYAIGNQLRIHKIGNDEKTAKDSHQVLKARTSGITRVAFADGENYRIRIKRSGTENNSNTPDEVFDLNEISLQGRGASAEKWLPAQRLKTRWTIFKETVAGETRYRLIEGDQPCGLLPLRHVDHGVPRTIATIDGGEKQAVVVGTSGRGNIYVYSADKSDPPVLLRQFRDHSADVRSLQSSADNRYLVSGSDDATACIWNLEGLFDLPSIVNKWGADFEIVEGQLVATDVRDDGPLYFRGVRNGDILKSVSWDPDGNFSEPKAMRDAMVSVEFDKIVVFRFTRHGRPKEFQSYPAWRPLATLVVDQDREWAFWTPAGYYDASFNGHQRFGWQINRGVELAPEFFRAAQFRKALERPDIMRRLLAAGSLSRAMRQTLSRITPPPADDAIVNQYLTKPRIDLVSPIESESLTGRDMTVTADISIPIGSHLASAKAFASGVPPIVTNVLTTSEHAKSQLETSRFEWKFRLPRDREIQLEIIAATDAESVEQKIVHFDHQMKDNDRRKPRLHLLAIGVSDYQDGQIQSLDFAASATDEVAKTLRRFAGGVYDVSAEQLVDADATRPLWKIYARAAAEKLASTVSPDDLVVMYLCGHGLRDRRTNQWYFVTADANYRDLMNDQYSDCLSFDDLSMLSSLPCRKLAVIDSCHSGAVQPVMRDDDLKSALRFLQRDLVITLTASEGGEEAAEIRETGLGRFTTRFLKAIQGEADANQDQHVTLPEAIDYVIKTVAEDSQADGDSQHPTASPARLLKSIDLPISTIRSDQ